MLRKTYIRSLDELGRVVLPKQFRTDMHLGERQMLEIYNDGDRIIIQKYDNLEPCLITGESRKDNHTFGNGAITLSPEGIEKLIQELQMYQTQTK